MEIKFSGGDFHEIIITDTNVNITEDVTERVYTKGNDGKIDPQLTKRDVATISLDMISTLLSDMIYYRKADYDSEYLIKLLFEKMPEESKNELIKELYKSI